MIYFLFIFLIFISFNNFYSFNIIIDKDKNIKELFPTNIFQKISSNNFKISINSNSFTEVFTNNSTLKFYSPYDFQPLEIYFEQEEDEEEINSLPNHLIVVSHGIFGTEHDLYHLTELLKQNKNNYILISKKNQFLKTLNGIETGSQNLKEEIESVVENNPSLKKISFIGNSLGGLYVRLAAHYCHDKSTNTICGLEPHNFMTIASPHLGVDSFTILDELHEYINKNYFLNSLINYFSNNFDGIFNKKMLISLKVQLVKLLNKTGQELFLYDDNKLEKTLLYKMATQKEYLKPLSLFKSRRIYGNLFNDFFVPLNTAGFMPLNQVKKLRNTFSTNHGIVNIIKHEDIIINKCFINETISINTEEDIYSSSELSLSSSILLTSSNNPNSLYTEMATKLNNLGWEKVIVNFKDSKLDTHNRISCFNFFHLSFINKLFKFHHGNFVIEDINKWLN